ncbi:MAG: hypothetical protein FD152_3194 [Xanthobacteraceae bacterium]|nr:MAG: hypothetical protein FD152_3194 [Xanthobacteraceae bacterium]
MPYEIKTQFPTSRGWATNLCGPFNSEAHARESAAAIKEALASVPKVSVAVVPLDRAATMERLKAHG